MNERTNSELNGYLPSLDGWRAVAISVVLVFHSRDALIRAFGEPMARFAPHMLLWGPFGVDLFFAISGLLITLRLLAEESTRGGISLKSFYLRRAFRILPASLTYLAVVALLGGLGVIAFHGDSWRAALLFYVNCTGEPWWYVGHFWSLAVEEHFYAFWPALLVLVRPAKRLPVALGTCATVLAWRLLNYKYASVGLAMGSAYFSHQGRTDFQLDGILWGAAIALAYHHYRDRPWVGRALRPWVGGVLFAAILLTLALPGGWKMLQAMLLFRRVAMPIVLLTTILNCRGVVGRVFDSWILRRIGRLSYSLYLWQQLFLVLGIESARYVAWPQRFPLSVACAVGCAWLSYHLIEKPMIRAGHRVAGHLSSQPKANAETVPA